MRDPAATIRRLAPDDAQAYRTLMLPAYERHPDAFTSTAAERSSLPLTWWAARLRKGGDTPDLVLGAFAGAHLGGAAGLSFEAREKARHKAFLFGMYVEDALRGRGVGRALVLAALRAARERPGVRLVQLTVTETNDAARRLYERCGFTTFGVEPYAVAVGDRYLGKVHMWCDVSR